MSQQINLFNPAFARKRDLTTLSGLVTAWSVAVLVVLIALLATAVRSSNVQHNLAQESRIRESAQSEMTRMATQLSSRRSDPRLTADLARLEDGLASRKEVMNTLHAGEIGDVQGFSGYFEAFARQSFSGIWLTGLRVANAGQEVVVEGRAVRPELVPGYLTRLNREKVMQGHAFSELEMRRPEWKDKSARKSQLRFIEFRLSTVSAVAPVASQGGQ